MKADHFNDSNDATVNPHASSRLRGNQRLGADFDADFQSAGIAGILQPVSGAQVRCGSKCEELALSICRPVYP
jgi:hypothetical protein